LLFAGVLASVIHGNAAAQGATPATQSFPSVEASPRASQPAPPASAAPSSATPSVAAPSVAAPSSAGVSPLEAREGSPSPELVVDRSRRSRPNWDLGAGLYASDTAYYASGFQTLGAATPAYRLSLERRLHRDTWLSLSGSFLHSSSDVSVTSQLTSPTRTSIDYETTTVAVLLGIRRALLTDIVELSWFGAAVGAWSWVGGDRLQPGESAGVSALPGASARTLGFTSGIAVERELIERLAVRLSSEIVQLQWSKSKPAPDNSPSSEASVPNSTHHGQTFLVHFAPSIDLRFYF